MLASLACKGQELQGHEASTKLRGQETHYQGQLPRVGLLSRLAMRLGRWCLGLSGDHKDIGHARNTAYLLRKAVGTGEADPRHRTQHL